jgi:hypothetical protein
MSDIDSLKDTTKIMILPEIKKKEKIILEKKPRKRIVANTKKWNDFMTENYILNHIQHTWLHTLCRDLDISYTIHESDILSNAMKEESIISAENIAFLKNQIQQKINGYKYQDMKKNIYIPDSFVTLSDTLQILDSSQMKCFYCETQVCIWYEFAREPKQWTLERIDNKYGHTRENVEIACLSCNLKRRTMYHERYVFTKKMKIVKQSEFPLEIIKQT